MRKHGTLVPLGAAKSAWLKHTALWATAAAISSVTTLLACMLVRNLIAPVRPASAGKAPMTTVTDTHSKQAEAAERAHAERCPSPLQQELEVHDVDDLKPPVQPNSRQQVEAASPDRDDSSRATSTGEKTSRARKSSTQAAPAPEPPVLPITWAPAVPSSPPPEAGACARLEGGKSQCIDSLRRLNIL